MSGNYNEYMSWRRMLILVFSSLSSFFIPTYEYERERGEETTHGGWGYKDNIKAINMGFYL